MIFQCIYFTKLECRRPSLKSLQTFIMIRVDMALCQVSIYLFQLVQYQFLSLHCHLSCFCQKSKLTWTSSYSNIALMTFHHDAPKSLVPGINFLEFLVRALSITSYHRWQWICKAYLWKPYCICRKFPVFFAKLILDLVNDIIIEFKYNTNLKIYNSKVNWNACENNFAVVIQARSWGGSDGCECTHPVPFIFVPKKLKPWKK